MNTRAIGVPMGVCVGLSLCCLNLRIAPSPKAKPAMEELAVINFASAEMSPRFVEVPELCAPMLCRVRAATVNPKMHEPPSETVPA
jgi:hypothetical protein